MPITRRGFLPALAAGGLGFAAVASARAGQSKPTHPAADNLVQKLGVMLQVDNLLDAYREEGREGEFNKEIEHQFELVEQLGAKWVRAGILWNQIERKQGHYEWQHVEQVIHAANRHRVGLVWLVGGTPKWNSRDDEEGVPRQLPCPHFREFLNRLRNRYGGQKQRDEPLRGSIYHWEIINEPNYRWRAEEYAILLSEAHAVIRADKQSKIVFGGLGGDILGHSKDCHEGNQINYFEKVVQHIPQGTRMFDFANFHLYGNDADRFFQADDSIEKYFARCAREIQKALERNGISDVPVWSTEFDYPSAVMHQPRGRYKGGSPQAGLQKQALFVKEWFPKIFVEQPERKVFWASLVDDFNDQGAFLTTGLCHWRSAHDKHSAGERKPAYQALQQVLGAK